MRLYTGTCNSKRDAYIMMIIAQPITKGTPFALHYLESPKVKLMASHRQLSAIWSTILGLIFTLATSQDQYTSTNIVPPDGNAPTLSFVGKGVQIYQCSYNSNSSTGELSGLSYEYQGAEAELFAYTSDIDEDKKVHNYNKSRWGYHYFLPHPDGQGGKPTFSLLASPADNASSMPTSTATFKMISSVAAANPKKDIPSLLLRATSHSGNGPLSMVSYAQRINTLGGAAPAGACQREGAYVRVPYRAQYRFWSQVQIPPTSMPASIMVPAGHALLASFFGQGFQIYRYDGSKWGLSNVNAVLSTLPGNPAVGRHYFLEGQDSASGQPQPVSDKNPPLMPQPTWEFFSPRGHVSATPIQKAQKTPNDIPWLLTQTTSFVGKESFASRVAYVQRLSTSGGAAPTSSVGAKSGDIYQSPYCAIYSFYGI